MGPSFDLIKKSFFFPPISSAQPSLSRTQLPLDDNEEFWQKQAELEALRQAKKQEQAEWKERERVAEENHLREEAEKEKERVAVEKAAEEKRRLADAAEARRQAKRVEKPVSSCFT